MGHVGERSTWRRGVVERRPRRVTARVSKRVAEHVPEYPETPWLWRASKSPARTDALLLDTHAWIWTLHNMRDQMSRGAWTHIDAAARERRLFVSDIS